MKDLAPSATSHGAGLSGEIDSASLYLCLVDRHGGSLLLSKGLVLPSGLLLVRLALSGDA
jgi:hypothetical protein